jgi:hypothetical protein
MATMTVEQALASTATGITVADTPTNIAKVVTNTALLARVSLFTMSANNATSAADAKALATLGSKFSLNGFRLTVRDTVAELSKSANAPGVAIATVTAVFDTAANIVAAATQSVITGAGSVVMSASADVTLAGMIAFTTMPSFSVNPGAIITLADTAANLLAITASQKRGALQAYKVAISSTVDVATATQLAALQNFSVATGVSLTISDTVSSLVGATNLPTLAAIARVVVQVADSVSTLLASTGAIATLASGITGLRTQATDGPDLSASQLATLAQLPNFTPNPSDGITVVDTAANLLALSQTAAALPTEARLSVDTTLSVSTAAQLAARFGTRLQTEDRLTITDTLTALASMTSTVRALAHAIVLDDTAAAIIGATSLPAGVTDVEVRIDGGSYTIAALQAFAQRLGEGVTVTLIGSQQNAALRIADTLLHLSQAADFLAEIGEAGPLMVIPTDTTGEIDVATAMALAESPGFDPHDYALSIADTGANLTTSADAIFGAGFVAITVTSGILAGSADQLLDPTLTFDDGAAAHLNADATLSAGMAADLVALPGFAVDEGVALTVRDVAGALTATANQAAIAMAEHVVLADDALLDAAQAAQLAALGSVFDPGAFVLGVADGAAALVQLAGSSALEAVNAWKGPVVLDRAATISAASAAALSQFTHLAEGPFGLTITGTVDALLATTEEGEHPDAWAALRIAKAIVMTADAVVSMA